MKTFEEYNQGNWEIEINNTSDSWWDYKHDAIEKILNIIEEEKPLNDYIFEGEEVDLEKLVYILEDMSEEDFYTTLEDIKKYADFTDDIKLYNISDEDELDFLKEDIDFDFDFD